MATLFDAQRNLMDALVELELQATDTRILAKVASPFAAADDVAEGELGRKMALVRECADALRAAENLSGTRDVGLPSFPRRAR